MTEGLSLEQIAEIKIARIRNIISWRTENGAFDDDEESKLFEWLIADRERLVAERDDAVKQIERWKAAVWQM